VKIGIIYGGTRNDGNTEILVDEVVKDLPAEKIVLSDYRIQPIIDKRHAKEGFQPVNDDYNGIIDRIMKHEALLFATPVYWYSMSGIMKNFIDRWSQTLRDPNYSDFKIKMQEKKIYVVTVGGDDPYIKALPMIQQFHYIFDFMGMDFRDYIIGFGNKPGDILQDKAALFKANQLNRQLKEM
jgi:multimeric flavodoxin WrbA